MIEQLNYRIVLGTAKKDWSNQYLTFMALEDETFKVSKSGMWYSLDKGKTWNFLDRANVNTPTVTAGSTIMWKNTYSANSSNGVGTFSSTGEFDVMGNIMSLRHGDNFRGVTSISDDYQFYRLFASTKINSAENLVLPATSLTPSCYRGMFIGSYIKIAPKILPATTLTSYCYMDMFSISSIVSAPELPATTLAEHCYDYMFGESLITIAPELPATTLVNYCYQDMFRLSGVTYVKCLATNISATDCLKNWLAHVQSGGTFVKNTNTTFPSGGSGIPSDWTIVNI